MTDWEKIDVDIPDSAVVLITGSGVEQVPARIARKINANGFVQPLLSIGYAGVRADRINHPSSPAAIGALILTAEQLGHVVAQIERGVRAAGVDAAYTAALDQAHANLTRLEGNQ